MGGYDNTKLRPSDEGDLTLFSISHAMSAAAGAFVGAGAAAAAAALILRGRNASSLIRTSTSETASTESEALRMLRQEVTQAMSSAESRLGTKFQNQERAVGETMASHYRDLHSRLDAVASARSELSNVSTKMDELRTVFTSPRQRGAFGEMQLEAIVRDVMHPGSYAFQKELSNGKRPDCVLRLPPPIGTLAIDSKFPMDAFLDVVRIGGGGNDTNDGTSDYQSHAEVTAAAARKRLSEHLRRHVRDVARKYIVPGETAESAILFVPSESLFAEVVDNHPEVVSEANRSKVWIACPTTLMAVLTTMRGAARGLVIGARADAIVSEVDVIVRDVDRLVARSERVERNIDSARENLRLMRVSIDKIVRRKQKLDVFNETDEKSLGTAKLPVSSEDAESQDVFKES